MLLGSAFLLVTAVNAVLMNLPLGPDGGTFLVLADGLLRGTLPYVQYIDHKPPGIYLFLAGILMFSKSVWAIRIIYLAINVLTAGVIFVLGRELDSWKSGAIAGISYLSAVPLYEGVDVFAEPPMALLITIASLSMWMFLRQGRRLLLVFAGVLAGGAILFKQTAGFFVLVGCLLLLRDKRRDLYSAGLDVATFALAVSAPILGIGFLYLLVGNLKDLVYWTIIANLTNYSSNSLGTSFSNLYEMLLRFPLFWLGSAAGADLAFRKWKRENGPYQRMIWEFLLTAGGLSLLPLLVRQYGHYFIHTLPFASLLVGILGSELWRHRTRFESRSALLAIVLIALLIVPTVSFGGYLILTAVNPSEEGLLRQQQKAAVIDSNMSDEEELLIIGHEAEYYHLSDQKPIAPNPYYIEVNRNITYTRESVRDLVTSPKRELVIVDPDQCWRMCGFPTGEYSVLKEYSDITVYVRD
ncbi:ArnT family glycosyltransferase [Haloglomus litoreum]|uniref:ArnT family glycosyltransferase n=1 Tax=Haloglomus litoreum TaxID=3034026 RepID=UPI0023E8C9E9|nr:glycosyltransferase family 39 protein [Haloglomus sp. DT116]